MSLNAGTMKWAGGWAGLAVWMVAALAGNVPAQVGDRAPIDQTAPPEHWEIPFPPVRSPEDSISQMELPAGFRVEVVAAEPLVQDPISFAFDERGRLWVLEWPSYNWPLREILPDLEEKEPPSSRVVVLEDTTGDGRMNTRTVFHELDWPRGIQPVGDGILVLALPDIVFLRDTTGDGKADHREVVYGGLGVPANPHAAPNSPLWTLDNWIYGLRLDERLRYAAGQWVREPAAQMAGQWGLSQDNYGRLFFSYNQDHLRGSLVPPHYAVRNPNYPIAAGVAGVDVRIAPDQTVWPHAITPGVNRRAQLRDDGSLRVFTANAGPYVYRGDQFPAEFSKNVFVAESAGRLIRRAVLSEEDGILTAANAYDGREFLFSHDERFRPVFTGGGPDGALYIADMYRGIIEGHIFVTTFLRNQIIERNLHQPFYGMGRIYRVVYEKNAGGEIPSPSPDDPAAWVEMLAHANGFWRDTAQRVIVEKNDRTVAPALTELAASAPGELTRLHAFWTLEGIGVIEADAVQTALRDQSYRVRMAALRVAESFLGEPSVLNAVLVLQEDSRIELRRQLLYSLGAVEAPQAGEAIEAMLSILYRDAGQPFMVEAALSGLVGRELAFFEQMVREPSWREERPGSRKLASALSAAVVNEGLAGHLDRLIVLAADGSGQPLWRRRAILEGLASAHRTELDELPASLTLLREMRDPDLREKARQIAGRFKLAGSESDRAPDDPVEAELSGVLKQGRALSAICAACHQPDGRGLTALAPPLDGSLRVTGPPAELIRIVLDGLNENPAYPEMPPLSGLTDEQLAAVLTYVRQAWSNEAPAISAGEVGALRSAASD